jgi:hypothetical protein
MPEPSMIGLDPSMMGGGPPPMPFDPTILEKLRQAGFDGGATMTPADLFIQEQSGVLKKYYDIMADHLAKTGQPIPGQQVDVAEQVRDEMYAPGKSSRNAQFGGRLQMSAADTFV